MFFSCAGRQHSLSYKEGFSLGQQQRVVMMQGCCLWKGCVMAYLEERGVWLGSLY